MGFSEMAAERTDGELELRLADLAHVEGAPQELVLRLSPLLLLVHDAAMLTDAIQRLVCAAEATQHPAHVHQIVRVFHPVGGDTHVARQQRRGQQ